MGINPAAWVGKKIVGWLITEQQPVGPPLCDFERVRSYYLSVRQRNRHC